MRSRIWSAWAVSMFTYCAVNLSYHFRGKVSKDSPIGSYGLRRGLFSWKAPISAYTPSFIIAVVIAGSGKVIVHGSWAVPALQIRFNEYQIQISLFYFIYANRKKDKFIVGSLVSSGGWVFSKLEIYMSKIHPVHSVKHLTAMYDTNQLAQPTSHSLNKYFCKRISYYHIPKGLFLLHGWRKFEPTCTVGGGVAYWGKDETAAG